VSPSHTTAALLAPRLLLYSPALSLYVVSPICCTGFEVAQLREKFPEKIPFRLTRMLINAMEVSGIEGNFRSTAESVMKVLRDNKESVMAVLEAFVYDPLINWRLLKANKQNIHQTPGTEENHPSNSNSNAQINSISQSLSTNSSLISLSSAAVEDSDDLEDSEVLNDKALTVIARVESKLLGKDFDNFSSLDVTNQVERLIDQATSYINLCQCYIGW
jgi:FKBP12-rapamycin complex-associated protein